MRRLGPLPRALDQSVLTPWQWFRRAVELTGLSRVPCAKAMDFCAFRGLTSSERQAQHGPTEPLRAGSIPRHRASDRNPCSGEIAHLARPSAASATGAGRPRRHSPGSPWSAAANPAVIRPGFRAYSRRSPRPTPDVPRVACLGETVSSRVASASRDMPGTDRGALQSTAAAACHAERAGARCAARWKWTIASSSAIPPLVPSFSEQNHRSPFDVLIRVANSVKPHITPYLPPSPFIGPTRLVSNVASSPRSHSSRFDAVWT